MRSIPLNLQTLYADLVQGTTFNAHIPASISRRMIKGTAYLYATEKHGVHRLQVFLGPANDEHVTEQAADIRRAAVDAKQRRTTVSLLKRAGLAAPSLAAGRLLEALANTGIFINGMVLVGTTAYQLYGPLVGSFLEGSALMTQDADLAAASLAIQLDVEGLKLIDVLRRADPTFTAALTLDPRALPHRFRSASGFEIDVITRYRSRNDDAKAVVLPQLGCAAQPLRFLEYLLEEPIDVVALYNAGVLVRVPQPARYAVHKLIIAQERRVNPAKRQKDLLQAATLFKVVGQNDPGTLTDALADARARGPRWRENIDRSLNELGPQIADSVQHSGKSL